MALFSKSDSTIEIIPISDDTYSVTLRQEGSTVSIRSASPGEPVEVTIQRAKDLLSLI